MTRFLLMLWAVCCLLACRPGVPSDVVQPQEMEKILYDIHLVDAFVANLPTPDSAKKVSAPIYKGVYKKYGIDSAKHQQSMAYYYRHPDLLAKIYTNIGARLTKNKEAETKRLVKVAEQVSKQEAKRQKQLTDSIKKANKVDSAKKAAFQKPLNVVNKISEVVKN